MNRYFTESVTFTDILKRAFRLHYLTLKYAILPIICITILKYIDMLLTVFITNTMVRTAMDSIVIAVVVLCLSVTFLTTHLAFSDTPTSTSNCFKQVGRKSLTIYATLITYIVSIIVVYEIMNGLVLLATKFIHEPSAIHSGSILIGLAMVVVCIATFAFGWPLSVIENKTIWDAFSDSAVLTDKNKFGIFILFLLLSATWLLISPAAVHEHLLSTYHLDVVFDFVVLSVAIPLLTNILLFLISDSKRKTMNIDL